MAGRPTVSRLLVSPETAARVDSARFDLMVQARKDYTKTQIHDALIAVALDHLDEVTGRLAAEKAG